MINWPIVQWNEVLTIQNGRNQKKVANDSGRYPIYGSGGVMGYADDYICEAGTTVIGRKGSINSPLYVTEKFWNVDTAFGLCVGEKLDNKYFYYFCLTYNFLKHNKATTLPSLTKSDLLKIEIPLPPLAEQKKIAAILDAADQLRQKDQQLIDHYTALSQSLFLEMFGDPVSNPMGWEKGASIDHSDCIVPGRDKPRSFSGSTPWITTNDLQHLDETIFSKKDIGLSDEEVALVKARVIPRGSVLLTCVGDLGVVSINATPAVVNQQLHTFQCDKEYMIPIFMMYALSYQKPYMTKMASSTTVPYMNKTVCNGIPMIYPPVELQKEFSRYVDLVNQQRKQAIISLKASEALFHCLLQQAFKGELTSSKAA